MDYEHKYKDALERAKEMCAMPTDKATMEYIFPELKESEGERIRKELIENFKWFCGDFPETTKWGKDDNLLVKDIIAWLEKQNNTLDPDKVIEWLENNQPSVCVFDKFKKDFGL